MAIRIFCGAMHRAAYSGRETDSHVGLCPPRNDGWVYDIPNTKGTSFMNYDVTALGELLIDLTQN